ncbi:MAG: universal stress protein [Proteobacteria bacterium]|nr:universal stress protein [Pseudomonadota bacterium]
MIALNDSLSSRAVIDYICNLSLRPEDVRFTLLHIYREPSSGEELMGQKYMRKLPLKYLSMLSSVKEKLVQAGFLKDNIEVALITDPYATVADGIIDQFKKKDYSMVVVGRKRMSKAEEFVMGDASIKLVRALERTAVMVVKLK